MKSQPTVISRKPQCYSIFLLSDPGFEQQVYLAHSGNRNVTLFNKLVSWRQISWRHGALIYLFGATGLIKSDRPDERLSRGRSAGQPVILPDPLNCVNIHSVCLCVLLYCALMLVFPVQGFFLSAPLNACLCVCVRERGIVHVQKNAEGG